jgi:hypothetical protein
MKPTRLLRTGFFVVLALLVSSCFSETTAPAFQNAADEQPAGLSNGPGEKEASKTSGTIAEIDHDAMQLRVGEEWFWADEHTKIKIDDFNGSPSFGDLLQDDYVEIEYQTPADEEKGFYAEEIKVKHQDDGDDEDDEHGEGQYYHWAEGYASEVDADNMRFRIGEMWFWVDENTGYCDDGMCWSFDDVQVGVWLKARYHETADEELGHYVMRVVIKPEHQFEWAEGYVEELDGENMRFRIGEMWFWVDENTTYCDGDDDYDDEMCWTFDDVREGVWVKVKYRTFLHDDVGYYALKVLIKPEHQFEWAEGYVEELDGENMRFRIGEMWFWVDENTTYCDDDDDHDDYGEMCWTWDDIQDGVWVKVKYRTYLTEDVGYYALKVLLKFKDAEVEGYVDEIDGDGMRLRVGDDWYWADEHTKIEIDDFEGDPKFEDIEVGDPVKIEYLTPGADDMGFYAKEIEVKETSS